MCDYVMYKCMYAGVITFVYGVYLKSKGLVLFHYVEFKSLT